MSGGSSVNTGNRSIGNSFAIKLSGNEIDHLFFLYSFRLLYIVVSNTSEGDSAGELAAS